MTVSEKKMKYNAEYNRAKYDRVGVYLYKEEAEAMRSHAAGRHESVNGFITRAIKEQIKRDLDGHDAS